MQEVIPYRKIFRLALVTSPLFGLFGATPILVFSRNQLSRISSGFLTVTLIIIAFWAINILLVRLWDKMHFKRKEWLRYGCSILLCCAAVIAIRLLIPVEGGGRFPIPPLRDMPRNFPGPLQRPPRFLIPMLQFQSINVLILVFLELVLLKEKKLLIESENAELKIANLEARHGRLKEQLHPHFMFNSLSILGALIKRAPDQAESYLERLSDLLRFSTDNDSQTVVKLGDEIEFCQNYLEMQQVRFGKALSFSVVVPDEMMQNGRVPIYSIQLLVENAIKHNLLTIELPLNIDIIGNHKEGTITVINNRQEKTTMDERCGIGLSNLSQRYQLLGQKPVEVGHNRDEFYVTLKILEIESSNHRG